MASRNVNEDAFHIMAGQICADFDQDAVVLGFADGGTVILLTRSCSLGPSGTLRPAGFASVTKLTVVLSEWRGRPVRLLDVGPLAYT